MKTIQQHLGVPDDWRIVEKMRHEIVIMPSKADIRGAERGNPMACALHNAACRIFNIPNCAIGARTAYIPQRDPRGRPYIARVKPTAETERAIKVFDRTGVIPEGGFHFRAPAPSESLRAQRASWHDRVARGAVGASGKKKSPKSKSPHQRKVALRHLQGYGATT